MELGGWKVKESQSSKSVEEKVRDQAKEIFAREIRYHTTNLDDHTVQLTIDFSGVIKAIKEEILEELEKRGRDAVFV